MLSVIFLSNCCVSSCTFVSGVFIFDQFQNQPTPASFQSLPSSAQRLLYIECHLSIIDINSFWRWINENLRAPNYLVDEQITCLFLSPLGFQHPIRLLDYTNKQQHPRRNKSKEIRQLQPWNGVLFYCLSTERLMIANFSGWWPFRRKEK